MPAPGTPLPHGYAVPEIIIHEMGDFRNHDGAQLLIHGDFLVFQAHIGGTEIYLASDLCDVLEAIQSMTKQQGS